MCTRRRLFLVIGLLLGFVSGMAAAEPQKVRYRNPGLVVDLGVGLWAWPLPMDYDSDGDMDLVVVCPDVPSNGTYFFENPDGNVAMPVFKPAVRIERGLRNVQVSYSPKGLHVLTPGVEYEEFLEVGFSRTKKIALPAPPPGEKIRANQWKYCDYDGDGLLDLVIGIGDWADYGWDNAFDDQGRWTRGPLHGHVYWYRNTGRDGAQRFEGPTAIEAAGKPVDVFGMPSPNLADFDGDGDLDLMCGEFLDRFTYFENVGSRRQPRFAKGRFLEAEGRTIRMDLQMITPVAVDWDHDGDVDLVVGDEDGRVALVEHTGRVKDGMPAFREPRYFQQQADAVKFGALVTPYSCDWDEDGDEDLVCGCTAGYVGWIENLDGGNPPRWAAPVRLKAGGETFRVMAGPSGSIQGPCEAKWGYTTIAAEDWDGDGRRDLIFNSIWGKVQWCRNVGRKGQIELEPARPVTVAWEAAPPKPAWNWWDPEPNELATQWRTTPVVADFNDDGRNDLLMLDAEGYLALFERRPDDGGPDLEPPRRLVYGRPHSQYDSAHRSRNGPGLLRLNVGTAGRSGRRKLCVADWDGDGRRDLLVNSTNVNWLRNTTDHPSGGVWLEDQGPLFEQKLAGHTTSPTVVDWNRDGRPDLLVGAEDGFLYYWRNPHAE